MRRAIPTMLRPATPEMARRYCGMWVHAEGTRRNNAARCSTTGWNDRAGECVREG